MVYANDIGLYCMVFGKWYQIGGFKLSVRSRELLTCHNYNYMYIEKQGQIEGESNDSNFARWLKNDSPVAHLVPISQKTF